MVKIIRDELIKIDPEGQRQYSVNAAGATLELDNLINNVEKELSKDISYIVFHDAYQYFETRFGVKSAGALTLNPDVLPGAKQITDIQELINDKGIKCIFSEPQYNPCKPSYLKLKKKPIYYFLLKAFYMPYEKN